MQYLQAFKKGAYNYIKEETDPVTQQPIPRKYFSGGFGFEAIGATIQTTDKAQFSAIGKNLARVGVALGRAFKPTIWTQQKEAHNQQLEQVWRLAVAWYADPRDPARDLDPSGDLEATPEFRRHLVRVLTERAFAA